MQETPSNPVPLYIALFCMLFSVIFNYTLSIMASPYIVGDLGGSTEIASYSVSLYAIGNALSIPLGKPLIARMGAARIVTVVLILFAFFSLMCAISPTNPFFNASRFLQGFAAGPLYAIGFHLFSWLQPKEKRGLFSSISLMIFTTGPVIGACWGGWVAYEWHWQWAFYLNVPLLLLLAWYIRHRLQQLTEPEFQKKPFDGIGYLFYFLGIFTLSIAIILGQELDWLRSHVIVTLGAIGIPSLIFFILWELNHEEPILDLKLLKQPVLSFALFNLAVLFSLYFGIVILLSLWLKLWVNYTPNWISLLLGIMALTGLFPMFLIDKRIARIDNRIFLALAIIFLTISSFHTMQFNVEIDFERIATSRIFAGLGLALFLAPIFRLCFHALPNEESMFNVLGLFQVTRALSSGLGASLYNVAWIRRQVFFHDRLGSSITAESAQTQEFFIQANTVGIRGDHANAQLEYYLQREATSLALDDCFYLMAWILIGLLITFAFTFFAKKGAFVTVETKASP